MALRSPRINCLPLLLTMGMIAIGLNLNAAEPYRPYSFLKEIPIGGDGGWDYLSIDQQNYRLFVSHADKAVVIDLNADAVAGVLPDTLGIHGVALSSDRAFTSNGGENKVGIFDLATLKPLGKVDTGANPDCILFEPLHQEVYAFNGRSSSVTVFSAKTGIVIATIPLSGKPEFAVADPGRGRVFCNIEDKSELAVIDTGTHQVIQTWPIAPGEEASGLALDSKKGRLFIGCHNQMLLMMDASDGKILASVPIGKGVDAVVFDPDRQLVFSSNGEGNVTIAHVDGSTAMSVVQTLSTEPRARTMALDLKSKRIYLASAKFEPLPPPSLGTPHVRPKIIPGTLKILVYEPKK